jgi:prolyl 4-hydroxylase
MSCPPGVLRSREEREGGSKYPQRHMNPFSATGSGTFPTHRFLFTELENPDKVLKVCVVQDYPENIYYYDPFVVEGDPVATEKNLATMTPAERVNYDGWVKTLKFNDQYKAKTGRSYLANYLRAPPIHYMWPADYFGQEHWITSPETHVVEHPPENLLDPIFAKGKQRVLARTAPRALAAYRDPANPLLNMTLRVLSVAPRVLEIDDFLSKTEVEHILHLAAGIELAQSSTGERETGEKPVKDKDTTKTRTSFNSWVARDKSPIIDIIYRRAGDLMRIDEALFRVRDADERPDVTSRTSLAEQLQLVHYGLTQEYTAHHDFGYTNIADKEQGARYATLLLYLNEGMVGGETSFPRWANAETFKELKVTPKIGKAVLFYSQLPDGNLDDFSEHAALPIKEGEKWLINLWVHSPSYER